MAGSVGVVPGTLSFGELRLMAEGRGYAEWCHTASILSAIHGACGVAKPPAAFHPYERERNRPKTPEQIEAEREADAILARAIANGRRKIKS